MNKGCLPSSGQGGGQSRALPAMLCWVALFIIGLGLGLVGFMEYLETGSLTANMPLEQRFSYKFISYGNLLLIGSTILYVAHLWFTARAVGRWATSLSILGALGLVAGLMARAAETYFMYRTGHIPVASLYEVMSLFSAITVLIYLVMERAYRTRSAGAFVMPIVAAAVLFEEWQVSNEQVIAGNHFSMFQGYWSHAHVLANFIGYGAFAVAAAMGVMYLLRHNAENHRLAHGFAIHVLPNLPSIDRLMHQAICLGFPVFTFATMLGIALANEARGRYWAWDPKETWTLIVWVTYASYFYLHYVRTWRGVRMAWWTIIGFGLSVFCFVGVNLFFSMLHSFG